jgi:hypothetical protein
MLMFSCRELACFAAMYSAVFAGRSFTARADLILQPPTFEARVEAQADSVFAPGAHDQKVGNPPLIATATWEAAFAEARVGDRNSLHSFATATTSGHASADALITDQLSVFFANGVPITAANIVITARVDGTITAEDAGIASIVALLDPFSGSSTGQPAEFSLDVPDGLAGHYDEVLVASYTGDISQGLSFNFSILVNAIVNGFGAATVDFGNTGVITDIQINDLNGNPIPDAYYTAASGIVYGATVPEPSSLLLMGVGCLGAAMIAMSRRGKFLRR